MHKFRKETPLQAHQNTQLKQVWEHSMVDYSTPEFLEDNKDDVNLELDKIKEKLNKVNKTENAEIKKIQEKIKSSKDDHEIKVLSELIIELDPTSLVTYFDLFAALMRLKQFESLEKYSKKAFATHNSEIIGNGLGKKQAHLIFIFLIGFSLYQNKKYTESLEYFEKVLAIDDKHPLALYWKSVALSKIEKFQEALRCCDRMIEIDEDNFEGWRRKGDILDSIGEYQNALRCFDKAISLDKSDSNVWVGKGTTHQHMDNHIDALQCFEIALTLDKEDVNIMNLKGVELAELQRFDEAEKCFMGMISVDKFQKHAWSNLALIYSVNKKKNFTKALEYASIGVFIDPDNPICLTVKGGILYQLKKYEESLECIEQVLRTQKKVEVYFLKAEILRKLNFKSKALECLNEVLSLENLKEEEVVIALTKKCNLLSELKNYKELLNVSGDVLAIDENNLLALKYKIHALREFNEYQKGLKYCERILEIDENDIEGWLLGAITLTYLKEHPRAEKYYKKTLSIEENNPEALYNLSLTLTEQKKYPEALKFINKFIEMNIPESPIEKAKELRDKLIKRMQEK